MDDLKKSRKDRLRLVRNPKPWERQKRGFVPIPPAGSKRPRPEHNSADRNPGKGCDFSDDDPQCRSHKHLQYSNGWNIGDHEYHAESGDEGKNNTPLPAEG